MASKCNFGSYQEQALCSQLIAGVKNDNIRRKLLAVNQPTFSQLKDIIMQEEVIQNQLIQLKNENTDVNFIKRNNSRSKSHTRNFQSRGYSQSRSQVQPKQVYYNQSGSQGHMNKGANTGLVTRNRYQQSNNQGKECYRCGRFHSPLTCPARQWKCYICGRFGHTSYKCRNKFHREMSVNEVNSDQDQVEYGSNNVQYVSNGRSNQSQYIDNQRQSVSNSMQEVDCVVEQLMNNSLNINSVSVNKLNKNNAKLVSINVEHVKLIMEIDTGAAVSVISYEHYEKYFKNLSVCPSPVKLGGISGPISIYGEICVKVSNYKLKLVICGDKNKSFVPLMGRDWLDRLFPNWRGTLCNSISVSKIPQCVQHLKSKFSNCFTSESNTCIKTFEANIILKENYVPVFMKAYEVPYSIITKISDAIDKLEKQGKIYKVKHSEWASPLVPIRKSDGTYRLCVDFKRTVNPNIKIDNYPLPTAENIFASMAGGKMFVVLDLSDAYTQICVNEQSQPLLTVNTHKGLYRFKRLIYGIASAPAIFQSVMDQVLSGIDNTKCYIDDILIKGLNFQDCYNTVVRVLQKLSEYNIKVNFKKCKWFCQSVEYLGHVIDAEGRKPSPNLVEAVVKAKRPDNVKELRSYLGLLNFYHNYIENLSTIVKPLRELTESKSKWSWTNEHEAIFELSKQKLINSQVLMHYNPTLPIVVYSDASPVGLGAVLCHIVKENNKSVEKPVAFASCSLTQVQKKYSQLDREALAIIYAVTKFHKYLWGRQFTLVTDNAPIKHILHPSKSIPTLAAHRLQHWSLILENYDYNLVHKRSEYLMHADALSRLPMNKVVLEIDNCDLVQSQLPICYVDIANETINDLVLLKVFNYTKNGWPNHMSDVAILPYFKIRHYISIMNGCLVFGSRVIIPHKYQAKVLLMLHEGHPGVVRTKMLARSLFWWPNMCTDIENACQSCEPCAIWIDVKLMKHCDASHVIKVMYDIFAVMGLPCQIVSDNGPPFDSKEFIDFCTSLNIKVTKSPPYHPESNGLAERNVQIISYAPLSSSLTKMFHERTPNVDLVPNVCQQTTNVSFGSPSEIQDRVCEPVVSSQSEYVTNRESTPSVEVQNPILRKVFIKCSVRALYVAWVNGYWRPTVARGFLAPLALPLPRPLPWPGIAERPGTRGHGRVGPVMGGMCP
ncbi:uncharacterized protein K02A2.6-like [Achroia grisella]|uniref:uncharacterized protein K02A2.6-like n=1 Tax=Achroia grisella TaxID=688607 RepID=UPI0027D31069|nr:uncharacterized protein K02A2.6-like [Achroia grisella]